MRALTFALCAIAAVMIIAAVLCVIALVPVAMLLTLLLDLVKESRRSPPPSALVLVDGDGRVLRARPLRRSA